jgi:hypothetical protein
MAPVSLPSGLDRILTKAREEFNLEDD